MNQQAPDATARADTGQAGTGIATGQEQLYAQGLPKGAIMQRFGSAASVVRDLPGWFIADGTQPPLVIDGVSYGSPNFSKRFAIGADGTAGFAIGDTGGAAAAGGHTHSFTQPDNHAHTANHTVGQPNDHGSISHSANHSGSAVAAHGSHSGTQNEVLLTPASGVWVNTYNSSANAAAGLAHANDHAVTQPDAHGDHTVTAHSGTTVAAHDAHTHANGAVGAVTSPATAYPPYVAIWILIKCFDG